ncbi:MAG: hypothetical protein J0L73_07225 [Verrucomicrobia bacterium]|nr:hypothetical protein [Verrucomicrobiota bacterium]
MRSQKISNRAPRPFKTKNDRWSGVREPKAFFSTPKPVVRPAKADAPAEKPADQTAAGE